MLKKINLMGFLFWLIPLVLIYLFLFPQQFRTEYLLPERIEREDSVSFSIDLSSNKDKNLSDELSASFLGTPLRNNWYNFCLANKGSNEFFGIPVQNGVLPKEIGAIEVKIAHRSGKEEFNLYRQIADKKLCTPSIHREDLSEIATATVVFSYVGIERRDPIEFPGGIIEIIQTITTSLKTNNSKFFLRNDPVEFYWKIPLVVIGWSAIFIIFVNLFEIFGLIKRNNKENKD